MCTKIPGKALGLSRHSLDHLLRHHAVGSGASLVTAPVSGISSDGKLFRLEHGGGVVESRVAIGAYGRRSTLDRKQGRAFLTRNYPYVAFKTHVTGIDTEDRVELYAYDGGYCGVSRVEDNRTNVCWIIHQRQLMASGGTAEACWNSVLPSNPDLARYIGSCSRLMEFLSASQLFFADKEAVVDGTIMVGDAAGMIAPLAGDGIAMAIDSALLAASYVDDFLSNRISRLEMEAGYTRQRKRMFRTRMRLARVLHQALVNRRFANAAIPVFDAVPAFVTVLVRLTRGR